MYKRQGQVLIHDGQLVQRQRLHGLVELRHLGRAQLIAVSLVVEQRDGQHGDREVSHPEDAKQHKAFLDALDAAVDGELHAVVLLSLIHI